MHVDVNGARLWFDVEGAALVPDGSEMRQRPTVVLVHGGPGVWDHSYFKPDFAPLAEHAQVVYLDLRGHGRSSWDGTAAWGFEACADDIRGFCDTVGIVRPIVFGHSMGGPIVLLYGARHPGHAAGLVVQSGFVRFDIPRLVEGFRRVAGDEVAEIAGRSFRGEEVADEEWARVSAAFGPHVPDKEQGARPRKNLELNSPGMDVTRRTDIVDQLTGIRSPTLVAVGELDPVTPVGAAEEIVHGLPDEVAQLEVIAAVGVLRDGIEMVACYGVANTSTGQPVTAKSRFSVGSLTKSMVATVVARLAEDGRLSLDDSVVAHVPELHGATWAERATVRDLLSNRSGLPLRVALEFDFAAQEDEEDDVLSTFAARVAAEAPTRIGWSYTNAGWCLLGRAIETVTGSVWEEAMRTELIAPAGLRGTTFATESDAAARVSGHTLDAGRAGPVEPVVVRAFGPAGTSIVSTAGDMLRFAALHLTDPALAKLRDPQPAPRIHAWLDGWCLGWAWFDWEGDHVFGWDSVIDGERAVLGLVPERDAAVVLMTNGDTGRALYRSLFAELMQALFAMSVAPLRLDAEPDAVGDLSRFAGVYAWPDRRIEVKAAKTRLRIKSDEGETEALPVDERTFVVDPMNSDNPTVTFGEFDAAGRPQVLYVMLWGLPRLDDELNA